MKSIIMSIISKESIDRLLVLKGKKQGDLAGAIGLEEKTFSARKKTGKFSEDEIKKMAVFFGVETRELTGEADAVGIKDLYQFLGEKTAQQDGMLRVLLSAVGELLAEKRGISTEEMHSRIIKAAKNQSLKNLDQLQ